MCLKLSRCLCLVLPLLLCVRSQRSGSWGAPKRGYGNDNGFWNSNAAGNSFSSNQNSGLGGWGTNVGNNKKSGFGDVYSNSDSDSFGGNGNNPSRENNNKKPGAWVANPTSSNFGSGRNPNRESDNEKTSSWDSNRPSKSNNGNSGNLQSDAFNTKKENEKKLASITNWQSNSNKIPSTEDNDNSLFSTWGSGKNPKPSSVSSNQNSRPSGSSNGGSNNNEGNNWNSESTGSNNWNSRPASDSTSSQNSRPAGGNNWSPESNSNNWNSNNNGGSQQNGNDNFGSSDYEDNSPWSSDNKKKAKPASNSNSGKNSQKNNQNSGSSKNNQKGKDNKPSGTNTWSEKKPSTSGNERNPGNSNTQNEKKPSTLDTSILDELDKNDWYFGRESDYPKPPFKSTLNIDVSELWNFDKNRRPSSNSGSGGGSSSSSSNTNSNNKRRRNRQIGEFEETQEINCECVNVNLCDEEDMIITQEDIKSDWRPLKAFRCQGLTEVCCTNPKVRVSSRMNNAEESEQNLWCGQRRIRDKVFGALGGNIAEPGEFPWSLSLENVEVNCSASLIHPAMALTAAHCVASAQPEELAVKAGVWKSDNEPSQSRKVAKIIPHPEYNSRNPRNDIALLVLENPFKLTDNVNTICLPVTNDKWDPNECLVAGWSLEEINGENLEVLEKGVVNFLPQEECQSIMLVTDLWRNYILHDSFVCGIERNKRESCLGDEGGPVICPSKKQAGTYLQIGIVSKGMNCDDFGRPGIFTNVLQFLDWINKNTFELGLFDDIDIRSL